MAPPWSREEEDAMLRAWSDVVESPQKNGRRGMFQRFKTLCGGHTERTETSLLLRRDRLLNIYELISSSLSGSRSKSSDIGIRKWLAMSAFERKAWFVKVNTKSYPIADIDGATFLAIRKIMERKEEAQQSRRVRKSAMDEYLTSGSLDASQVAPVVLTSEAVVSRRHKSTVGCDGKLAADGASKSTSSAAESDDGTSSWEEMAARSPVATDLKRKRQVDLDLLESDGDTESRRRKLRTHKGAEERRQILEQIEQDRAERRELLALLKQDRDERNKVLDEIKQRERDFQRERSEWKVECIKMKHRWARMHAGKHHTKRGTSGTG